MKKRSIMIVYASYVDDELWNRMVNEIVQETEQIACDYAIAATNDHYFLDIFDSPGSYYG